MPVGEVKNLVNKLEVEVGSASLSIVFHLVSKWNCFSGARQGRHPEGGSVRSPPPPRPPRLHQHRPHTLVALHCPPWPGQLLLHFTLFWKPTKFNSLYQSGGGPLTFVPGGLKIEGSTQVIFSEPWCLHTHVILNTDATKGCWRLGDRQADLWDPKAHLAWRQVRLMTLNVNQQISNSSIVEQSSCDIAQQPGCVRIRPINSDRETKHRAQVVSCLM